MRPVSLSTKVVPSSIRYCRNRSLATQHPRSLRTPREPIVLDASLHQMLQGSDGLMNKHHSKELSGSHDTPILQIYSETKTVSPAEDDDLHRDDRKSPAAAFGSGRPRQLDLPAELEDAITGAVNSSDKYQLRSDAKRLFLHPRVSSSDKLYWTNAMPAHSSKMQERIMGKRDGMAFISTAMPAQYAAIRAVLNEAKLRLEPNWRIDEILDFGSKTGNGFWASRSTFGELKRYVGVEHRTSFTAIAKVLMSAVAPADTRFEQSFGKGITLKSSPSRALGICAFTLSELKTDVDRKQVLKQLWDSGAEYMVIIDHGTKDGFKFIGEARQYLLRKGRKELEHLEDANDQSKVSLGAHVVAPCPHDSACPLHSLLALHDAKKPTRLAKLSKMGPTSICHFSQRVERPDFVRLTKHVHKSYEDILYSYVAIRRGPRPTVDESYHQNRISGEQSSAEKMRVGVVGIEEARSQLLRDDSNVGSLASGVFHFDHPDEQTGSLASLEANEISSQDVELMRQESYTWPRVVYPPLKRSGHVILDSCTQDGNISRLIIPKSQGKQPFYDARKASWGDIFPHSPKNGLELRTKGASEDQQGVEEDDEDLVPGMYDFQLGENGELERVS